MKNNYRLFIAKRNGLWGLFMYTNHPKTGERVPMKRPFRLYQTLQGACHAAQARLQRNAIQVGETRGYMGSRAEGGRFHGADC